MRERAQPEVSRDTHFQKLVLSPVHLKDLLLIGLTSSQAVLGAKPRQSDCLLSGAKGMLSGGQATTQQTKRCEGLYHPGHEAQSKAQPWGSLSRCTTAEEGTRT